ncbi:MAG: deoxyguanosinetriphosphate triphosphohydrolase, partial [Anaerotignum sp.]|nr:deoxyguanosinetriphosphate triphosphohydrolase [Anaerotignum sp.]
MELRLFQEELEEKMLGQYAAKSVNTKGRQKEEEKCDLRTDFQRDRDRIIHCKSFRRMKHKTQVFISPEGDHYRTRLTHTLEVSQIARSIARALRLNEDLTEAIALGHDLGHTPFGHAGERKLDELCRDSGGFAHNEQSLRVVERLEKDGRGLNLTWEVRDGILNHRTSGSPSTLEGKIVQLSDKIAYTNHDIDDAIRAGMLRPRDIPREIVARIGTTSSSRINAMIRD